MDYNIILEAARWLGKDTDAVKILRLKELADNKSFFVTVWGHYSAGKSKLLNNILQRDLLPVQSRETTAVLTYIRYGEEEGCTLRFEDGTSKAYGLEALKEVFQNTEKFDNVGKIDHIEVFVKNSLLKSGLTLVDTPGVNTIIQKHQDLAVDAIEQSGRILYVLGNAPSDVDREFIKQIALCGVKIDFIRTKCDKFIVAEEDADSSLKKEEETLMSFIGETTNYIPVSNEKNSKWYGNVDRVRELLYDISAKLSENIDEMQRVRTSVFSELYIKELKEEAQRLNDILNGQIDAMDRDLKKYKSEIRKLERKEEDIEEEIEEKVKYAKTKSERALDRLITVRRDDFEEEINDICPDENAPDEIKKIYTRHIAESIAKIQQLMNSYFDEIIEEEIKDIRAYISEDISEMQIPVYAEVQQENSRALELYKSRLAEIKQKIKDIMEEQQKNSNDLARMKEEYDTDNYQTAMEELSKMLEEIPTDPALKLSDHQKIQPSSVFKKIGGATDLALLLLPGDLIASGVKTVVNTGKMAQALNKMGKAGEIIVKTGNALGKSAVEVDKARDHAYTLSKVFGSKLFQKKRQAIQEQAEAKARKEVAEKIVNKVTQKTEMAFEDFKNNKRSNNILDTLSVAYWAEKFGKKFDSEPQMEVDLEEEAQREQRRKELTEEQQRLSDERMRKKRELGLLEDKEEELKILAREEELKQNYIEREMEEQKLLIQRQARKQALKKFCKEYDRYYGEVVMKIANSISEQYFRSASQNLTMYMAGQTREVKDMIEGKKAQIDKLLALKESGNQHVERRLEECDELLRKLEMSV